MMHLDAREAIEYLQEMFPRWRPTAAQIEAWCEKLTRFAMDEVKAAAARAFEPGKKSLRERLFWQEVEAELKKRQVVEQPTAPVVPATEAQKRQMLIQGAEDGNELCMALCRKKGIAFTLKEIPI